MKNNLNLKPPTEEKASVRIASSCPPYAIGLKASRDCGIIARSRVREPGNRPLEICQPCKGVTLTPINPTRHQAGTSSNQTEKLLKNAHFPSGTHQNRARFFSRLNPIRHPTATQRLPAKTSQNQFGLCTPLSWLPSMLPIIGWPSNHKSSKKAHFPSGTETEYKYLRCATGRSRMSPQLRKQTGNPTKPGKTR